MEQHAFFNYSPTQVPDTHYLHPAQTDLAYHIAAALQESEVSLVQHILNLSNGEYILHVLSKVRDIQAQGGMLNSDRARLKTPGGLFFYLVKQDATPEQRKIIFQQHKKERVKNSKEKKRNRTDPQLEITPYYC